MADHEKVYSIKFDVAKAQRALGKFNKYLERSIKLVSKLEITGKRTFRAFADGYKKMERGADRVNRKTQQIGKTALNSSKQIEKAARRSNKSFGSIGAKASAAGRTLTRRLTLPLALAGVASMKFSMDLNEGMAKIATLIPGQLERVKDLKKEFQALAIESGTSTNDLVEGGYATISAWGDSADTMERMRIVAQAAQAGIATTGETLDLIATVTENYGDNSAKAFEHVTDLAFVTNKLAKKAPFAEMAVSMGKVVPIAKQLDISQEDLFATMTAGAGITGNVAEVTTQIRGIYTSIIKGTPAMTKAIEKSNDVMGTNYENATEMVGALGTLKFLQQIKENTKGVSGFQKALGGRTEGLVLALALVGARGKKYSEALKEMETETGQMKIAHKEITEGINAEGFAWNQTKQKMKVFAQNIGDRLMPVLGKLLKGLEPVFKAIEKMDEGTLEWGIKIAGLLMVLGPALKIFGGLATVFGAIKVGALGIVGTNAAMSSFFTTQGANATTLTTKMGLLARSLGAVAAAAAAGYAIGTVISKAVVEPAAAAKAKREDVEADKLRAIKYAAKHGTFEQKKAALKSLEERPGIKLGGFAEQIKGGRMPGEKDDPLETLAYGIVGAETPAQAKKRQAKERTFAEKQLRYQLPKDYAEAGRTGRAQIKATESVMGYTPGKQRRMEQGMTNNITINAPGGDPKAIGREVEKALSKKISRGAAGIGASDQ